MTTTIGAAGLALSTLLETAARDTASTLYRVQVTFGPPDQYEEQEVIAILGAINLAEETRNLGPNPVMRDEDYSLEVAVKSYDPSGESKSVWSRGITMYDAVRVLVLADPSLGGVVQWALPTPLREIKVDRPAKEDGAFMPGWFVRADLAIVCKGRPTP